MIPLDADSGALPTRRKILRIGGGSLLGLSLPQILALRAHAADGEPRDDVPGWGRAKSVILIFLQGGPSHLDLWDPKDGAPEDVRSVFETIPSKVPGMEVTELLPRLAQVTDKLTLIRSMSYSPVGLFNHIFSQGKVIVVWERGEVRGLITKIDVIDFLAHRRATA